MQIEIILHYIEEIGRNFMGIVKYNEIKKTQMIMLFAEGYSLTYIASVLEVSLRTVQYWISKYNLRPLLDKARKDRAEQSIELGLSKLAEGSQVNETTDKFTYNREATRKVMDEEGNIIEEKYIQPVERTTKKKCNPPDSKAIEILSRKYAKEFDTHSEERELTTKLLDGFTMRQLQEARKHNPIDKGSSIDAEFSELSVDSEGADS